MTVAVYVPTRGHVYHEVVSQLQRFVDGDPRARGPIHYQQGNVSVASVRNEIVQRFLASDAEVLLMVDDDTIVPATLPLLVNDLSEVSIAAGVVPVLRPGRVFMPNVYRLTSPKPRRYDVIENPYGQEGLVECDAVGTGCIAIRREVLTDKHLAEPFRPRTGKTGLIEVGEDIEFCWRAKARGHRVGADFRVFCEHFVDVHANGIAQSYISVLERGLEAGDGAGDGRVGGGVSDRAAERQADLGRAER